MADRDAYAARIGYSGSWDCTLATLQEVHGLHAAAIPFENLDPLTGRPVSLALGDLERKLVGSRRGGYCFEQNTLLRAILEEAGFTITALAARVLWGLPAGGPMTPLTHMLLKVDLEEGAYIADAGFGGYLLSAPLKLICNTVPEANAGSMRLLRCEEGAFTLQARIGSSWRDVYRFTLEPQFPADFEVANWFTSTHPASRFRNNLVMERLTPQDRLTLFNRKLTRRYRDGRVEEQTLQSPEELSAIISADFCVDAPVDPSSLFHRLPPP